MIPNGEAEISSVASFLPWLVWAWQGLCLETGSRRMHRCLPLMIAVCVYLALLQLYLRSLPWAYKQGR
jgi:hypothetical protein